ncbi:MAG: dUTP diphosphatase [Spirochaetota bacterium]|nr:dUTP diphosphatase [Spirochaetota bacterium]
MITVKIKVSQAGKIPEYQSKGSSGADVFTCLDAPVIIEPGDIKLIPTGIYLEIPHGYEAQIRPRSGLAFKHGITLLNTPGTIDSDYRGEIGIIVANFGKEPFIVQNGMRIAQMVFCSVEQCNFIEVENINITERNQGGFGHTGI